MAGIFVLSGGDANVEGMGEFGVTVAIVGREGLLVPEAAHVLVDAAPADGFVAVEDLIGVNHDAALLAAEVEGDANAGDVVVDVAAAHLDLHGAEALLERRFNGAAVLGAIGIIRTIPAAHRIDGHGLLKSSYHPVDRQAGQLAEDVPDGDVGCGNCELGDALYAVVFESLPQVGAQTFWEGRIFAHQHRLHLLFEDGLNHGRTSGDHAEGAVSPACDAGVGVQPKRHASAIDAQGVDGVHDGITRRHVEQVRLEAGDLDGLAQGLDRRGEGRRGQGGEEVSTLHGSHHIRTAGGMEAGVVPC